MQHLKIGFVTFWWLPVHGGAERYLYNLGTALTARGVPLSILSAGPAGTGDPTHDGVLPVTRCGFLEPPGSAASVDALTHGMPRYEEWCETVLRWIGDEGVSHVLVNQSAAFTADFIKRIRSAGRPVGVVMHDHMDFGGQDELIQGFLQTRDWDATIARFRDRERNGTTKHHRSPRLPLALEPDFVLCNTDLMRTCVDPNETLPTLTVHPVVLPLEAAQTTLQPRVTVSFLNPLPQKGALHMAGILGSAPAEWTFRVLHGGWGNAMAMFPHWVHPAALRAAGRVNFHASVANIAEFFASTDIYAHPSVYEGYGMTPVEALYCDTPTVATDLPTHREGVGTGARLVPWLAHTGEWIDALREVLADRERWRAHGRRRRAELDARMHAELDALRAFLTAL